MSEDGSVGISGVTSSGNVFVCAWKGQEHLALVWWAFGIPLNLATRGLNSSWVVQTFYQNKQSIASLVLMATLAMQIVWSVMAWRCAPNTDEYGWKWVVWVLLIGNWAWFLFHVVV